MATRFAMFIDTSKCMACRGCQVACKQWNDLRGYVPGVRETTQRGTYENPPSLDPETYTRIRFIEHEDGDELQWLFLKEGCMHCGDPACVGACPTGALKQDATTGLVTFERELCNGCGYCTQFCPYHVPQLDVVNPLTGEAKSSKCTFCQDRTLNGLKPACVKTCPAGALDWGNRDEMVAKAEARVRELKEERGMPNANVYGDTQLGGLGRIYVLKADPEVYGLDPDPAYPVTETVWQKFLQPIGEVVFGATIVGAITAFFLARRNVRMEEVE